MLVVPGGYPWGVAKRFLIIFLIAVAFLAATAVTHYHVTTRTERVERVTSELLNVRLGKTAIERDLENVTSDLMFLARHNEAHQMFESNDPILRSMLVHQFLTLIEQKGKYDQIRLLDGNGVEIIRVNYNDGNPAVVPADQLQNKAQRYYFKRTWDLARGEVYISPFDLNIEHGRIERPLKPMIRFGTLVSDHSGRKIGVLLINYLGGNLIGEFKRATANISEQVMLLNAEGYWLNSPRPDDEWGFMFGNGRTFAKTHPDAWRRVKAADTGQFFNDDGLFSFTTIHPISHPAGQRGIAVTDRGFHWKAVSHVTPRLLTTAPGEFARRNLFLYAGMLGLLAVASALIAWASVGRRLAETQVELEKRVRGSLEERVEKRTRELHKTQSEKDLVVEQLIQAEKMSAIGTMTSGIGHEINNPLYAILGAAEAIRDEEDISRCRGHGRDIITYCKHIAEIIKNLSGYVRPAEEHDLEPVDVNEKICEAISMARRSLLSDHVEIRENLFPVSEILAKSEEIQQALFNVIRNGIQAVEGKGTLEITSRQADGRVSIQIRDTGAGIAPEHLSKIYDPFFTTKGPDEGEGLGLFVVQQIVGKYAGTVAFESERGKSTICTIEFPVGEQNGRRDSDETQDPGRR